ncbi:uncharacterized protein Dwil_GK14157 [Drosophila willistoni]|uniref:Uncharacterized protein n=1 Tax=Drosophila willistoni TaxID=7260 RepID=B4NGZ8_DROWI|nr:uncharacterized protein Dwil_GK14157 [Drosophila willistoni]
MAHFCWQLKLLILLLMLCRCQSRPRPAPVPSPMGRHSELIAGNEFLKLFLDHDEQQRNLHSSEDFEGRGEAISSSSSLPLTSSIRTNNARSLEHKTRYRNANSQHEADDGSKQQVKLVTTGSKIVFLEDPPNHKQSKTKLKDEVKVVAVSVSSSSKRGPPSRGRLPISPVSPVSASGSDFVNRSHKSELSIEETEPRLAADAMDGESGDSLNSASNIQNVLAAPLVAASHAAFARNHSETDNEEDDKLLPFQTVIYHDTKPGNSHGPQSRSISYSSISQNVEDLQGWQQSAGILAEAQRNVSESLQQRQGSHASEPSKFYSIPSKMYSVPSKFYSEPAKVYSEPAKMYGQPEKVYSEPAKVYGQPSKFYSEPAKVYSQPAKVYGEPAKTYWPQSSPATTTSTTAGSQSSSVETPLATTTSLPPITVPPGPAPTTFVPSRLRRPAIVSRIAFGEAQTTSTTTTTTSTTTTKTTTVRPTTTTAKPVTTTATATGTSAIVRPTTWQQHYHKQQQQQQRQSPSITASQPPRRVLFNLDKLPYDLLNAPQPQSHHQQQQQHLLEPILSKSDYQQQHHHHQQPHNHHRPCWEQRQHSSLSLQHSNQNAKGLPNRDLVKCVSTKFAQQHPQSVSAYSYSSSSTSSSSSSSSAGRVRDPVMPQHFTTERPELYTPTPEQNYEIEESVSVMTNGRAHGLQGGAAAGVGGLSSALAIATTPAGPVTTLASTTSIRNRGIDRGRGSVVYNANANANDYNDDGGSENDNNNNNGDDDDDDGDVREGDDGDGNGNGNGNGNGDESDEDKVAYVVEGRNYRKYRVEEKTDDGFIVGEYGVVDHNDGNLRGVRYTADSTINRSLIQKALLTFLKLK